MAERLQTIDIEKFRSLFPDVKEVNMGKDFCLARIPFDVGRDVLSHPFRLDAYAAMFCIEGEVEVCINLDTYEIVKNQVVINTPGNILRVNAKGTDGNFIILAVSPEFMSSMRVDFTALFKDSMAALSSPCIDLGEKEMWLFSRYVGMCRDLIQWSEDTEQREALAALISSFYYALGSSLTRRANEARSSEETVISSRSKVIYDQFIRLVNDYHSEYRNVDFYAKKLNLTPKYLSKVIKQVSGRSAPEWVDAFVILEAKNMLRNSDMSVKQIMYNLNFDNHSVFYKYFRSHTGMTPTEYRNS